MIKIECKFCNKEFFTSDKRNKYCSKECYHKSRKGKAWGGALNTGKGSHGKYSDFQVSRMVAAKKLAYESFVKEHFEEYNIKRVEFIIQNSYVQTLAAVVKMMNYPNNLKGKNGNFTRNWEKELEYALKLDNFELKFNEIYLPDCYRKMTPEQLESFKNILLDSENWYDFIHKFESNWRKIGISGRSGMYANILIFIQKTGLNTHALNQSLSKNLSGCGSSCEIKIYNLLSELGVEFVSQAKIEHSIYKCENEKIQRTSYLRPDFIVNKKFIIEVNGDFWHGYNERLEDMTPAQQKRVQDDWEKYNYYNEKGYRFIVIWEHEIVNISKVKERILNEVSNESNYSTIIYK